MTTGELIKDLRTKAGFTQQKLADLLDVNRVKVVEWEKGVHEPRYSMVEKIKEVCKSKPG